jgi:hypothetical protein
MGATYIECSSKEMRGVDEVFQKAVDTVVAIEDQDWATQQSHQRSSTKPGGGGGGVQGKKIKKRTCKIL